MVRSLTEKLLLSIDSKIFADILLGFTIGSKASKSYSKKNMFLTIAETQQDLCNHCSKKLKKSPLNEVTEKI
jgi:hypothetical protein